MRTRAMAALIFAACAVSVEDARGAAWLAPTDLASGIVGDSTVELTPQGETIAVWGLSAGGQYRLQASIKPPGGSFAAPIDIVPPGNIIENLDLAIDPGGNAILTWRRLV